MENMKAVRIHRYGGPEVVRFEDAPHPEAGTGQVLLRVHAAGVNPVDWKIRAGYLQRMRPLPMPVTLGGDVSGVVEAVGQGVGAAFKPGEEVYGQVAASRGGSGSFAEFATAPAGTLAVMPRILTFAEAAALPLVGVSALQGLTEHLKVQRGWKILIHGGAGGIGSLAIQIARYLGAQVATTVTGDDIEFVRKLGANEIVDYRKERFEEKLHGLDAVFDTVGGDTYLRSFKVLKRGGRIVSMLEPVRQDLMREYGVEAIAESTEVDTARLTALARLVDQGIVKVYLDRIYSLQEAPQALQQLEKGNAKGKLVLKVA